MRWSFSPYLNFLKLSTQSFLCDYTMCEDVHAHRRASVRQTIVFKKYVHFYLLK